MTLGGGLAKKKAAPDRRRSSLGRKRPGRAEAAGPPHTFNLVCDAQWRKNFLRRSSIFPLGMPLSEPVARETVQLSSCCAAQRHALFHHSLNNFNGFSAALANEARVG
jgi:hypothetical protein